MQNTNFITKDSIVSITKVELSKDIKIANIYISIFNINDNDNNKLNFDTIIKNKKHIRYQLALRLKSKYVPDIKFILDKSIGNYDKINKYFKK